MFYPEHAVVPDKLLTKEFLIRPLRAWERYLSKSNYSMIELVDMKGLQTSHIGILVVFTTTILVGKIFERYCPQE